MFETKPALSVRTIGITALLGLLFNCSSLADDNLHPEPSTWEAPTYLAEEVDYHAILRLVIPGAFTDDVRARLVAENYGYPENIIGIKQTGAAHSVFVYSSSDWLWAYSVYGMA